MNDLDVWPFTLAWLRERIPRGTFNAWLADCVTHIQGNTLTLLAASNFAKTWLQTNYKEVIEAALHDVTDRDFTLIIGQASEEQMEDCGAVIRLVNFDPISRGFTMVPNYSIRFWQPYLGKGAFALWLTLRSFAYDAGVTKCWPSIHTLAGTCFRGDRGQVRGRKRKDPATEKTQWHPGALQTLEDLKIVWWTRQQVKLGEHIFLQYIFSVLDNLPLLTPSQVETLPINIQRRHDDWLKDARLDRQQWEQLDFEHIIERRPLGGRAT